MKVNFALACVAASAVCACATKPEAIAPAYISELQFQPYTCEQVGAEQARVEAALEAASAQQRKARSNDAVAVLFLGVPVSTLSGGNVAGQVAQLKGLQIALQKTANLKDCARPAATPAPSTTATAGSAAAPK